MAQYPAITQAIIFGSRAKGNYRPGSDVDIALEGNNIQAQTISLIRDYLNEETLMPYHFDVLNLQTLTEEKLRAHITRVGKVIYSKMA